MMRLTTKKEKAKLRVTLVVPTYNGGKLWQDCATSIAEACRHTSTITKILIVDSSSTDNTVDIARQLGFAVHIIHARDFDHAGTRNLAASLVENCCDVVVFLTQDAIIESANSLRTLICAFNDQAVAVAYGRQMPHRNANPMAMHARIFSYKGIGYVADESSRHTMGLKAAFASNSFAAYRISTFSELGGFPDRSILAEDMYFAAKAIKAGFKVAYVADAAVRHSHNYGLFEEFRRYFDIGVFHRDEEWIAQYFGGAGGEGRRFLMSELRYLSKHGPLWIPRACLNNLLKIVGYKLGKNYRLLPSALRRRLSMHHAYWR